MASSRRRRSLYPAPKSDGAAQQPSERRVQLAQDGALDADADRLDRLTLALAVDDEGPRELLGPLVGGAEAAQGEHFPRLVHGRYLTRVRCHCSSRSTSVPPLRDT